MPSLPKITDEDRESELPRFGSCSHLVENLKYRDGLVVLRKMLALTGPADRESMSHRSKSATGIVSMRAFYGATLRGNTRGFSDEEDSRVLAAGDISCDIEAAKDEKAGERAKTCESIGSG